MGATAKDACLTPAGSACGASITRRRMQPASLRPICSHSCVFTTAGFWVALARIPLALSTTPVPSCSVNRADLAGTSGCAAGVPKLPPRANSNN